MLRNRTARDGVSGTLGSQIGEHLYARLHPLAQRPPSLESATIGESSGQGEGGYLYSLVEQDGNLQIFTL